MKITKPKSFIINRKKWYRGKDSGSMLRRPSDGKQCCLGFYARACGVKLTDITGHATPASLDITLPGVSRRFGYHIVATNAGDKMVEVNDDDQMPEPDRESKLRTLFNRIKVKVKFIN